MNGLAHAFRSNLLASVGVAFAATLVAPGPAAAAGRIVGLITVEGSGPLAGAHVQFFEAVNAEVAATTTSGTDGTFDSGLLAAGPYRVRVAYASATDKVCVREYLGEGDVHADVFDTARVVGAVDGQVTEIAVTVFPMRPEACEPSVCVPGNFGLSGVVFDAVTGAALQGIKVRLKEAESAILTHELTTDESGSFLLKVQACLPGPAKVRLVDPSGSHVPEYVGAGSDTFSAGTVFHLNEFPSFREDVARLTPGEQLAQLEREIEEIPLPASTARALAAVLGRAEALLQDGNPNNDRGACGLVRAFTGQLGAAIARGELTPDEGEPLLASAEEILQDLGCGP